MVLASLLALTGIRAQSDHELYTLHTFEGHTPESYQWEVVNKSIVAGADSQGPHVVHMGKVDTWQECQQLCAKNTTCLAFDWCAGNRDATANCGRSHNCWFRTDTTWHLAQGGACNDVAGRKVPPTPSPTPPPPTPPPNPPLGYQPNIVFILTDDQDTRLGHNKTDYTELGSMEVMPNLQELLIGQGARMSNAFVNTPICCPSRTEFFSGRYYHNIGPPNDPGGCMHVDTSNAAKKDTSVFGLLTGAGYEVGVFGKVTNDQSGILKLLSSEKSITWSSSPIDYNSFDGLPYYNDYGNGTTETERLDKANPIYGTTYQSTQIGNRTLKWLDHLHETGKITGTHRVTGEAVAPKPFFAYIGPHAPHYPAEPAPWHQHAFDDVTIPLTPNYNTSFEDKTQHIRQNPALSEPAYCWQNQHFRDRWSSLLSVDDIVKDVVGKLDAFGVLDKTFIFYSSDHGYKQGQWRVGTSKEHPFETDIRIPLLARGPGIKPGSVFPHITGNVDVSPTLLALAGIHKPLFMDGKSMLPWLMPKVQKVGEAATAKILGSEGAEGWRDRWLVEYLSVGTYYNDHSSAWSNETSSPGNVNSCGGPMPKGPEGTAKDAKCVESEGVGDGNCYFVDSTHSNSWRSLRVLNATSNLAYTEYDPTWKWNTTDDTGAGLQFYELYDLNTDPYQMKNLYPTASPATKADLHGSITTYYECKGDLHTASNCP